MIEIIQAVFSFAFIVGFAALAVAVFKLKTLNTQLFHISQQLNSDNKVLASEINKVADSEAADGQEGFIKFISQSRDWAFNYIEEVQKDLHSLKELHEKIGAAPKTAAQANDLDERISKVLSNLPEEKKKV